jgi:peptidoglycan/xylan/chitin deacetylase (PgdA/CDA1 family)
VPFARLAFYGATAAGVALAVWSLLREPPPLWFAASALAFYLALVTVGVTFSRFSMFADVVTSGPQDARGVALTFDDGPDPRSTPAILEQLQRAGARATFFVIGRKVEAHPELVKAIVEGGHALGLHGYAHERLFSFRSPRYIRADLERCLELVHELVGERPRLFRAPIGHISPAMARVARELDLQVIGWSVRGVDGWSGAKPDVVAGRVVSRIRDGAIVLLHDAAERGDFVPASVEALPAILEAADRRQLSFVRVDSWLGEGSTADQTDAHEG